MKFVIHSQWPAEDKDCTLVVRFEATNEVEAGSFFVDWLQNNSEAQKLYAKEADVFLIQFEPEHYVMGRFRLKNDNTWRKI